jgi:hypothetical protein
MKPGPKPIPLDRDFICARSQVDENGCLICQLAELNTGPAAALIALSDRLRRDRFVRDTDRALRLIDNGLTERADRPTGVAASGLSGRPSGSAAASPRSVSPSNVVPLDSWSRRVRP